MERDAVDVDLDVLVRAGAGLDDVEAALHRIDDGSYGRCARCGGALGDGLLGADPLATSCAGGCAGA